MNFKTLAYSLFAVLFLISCDNDTSGLGASLTPESDAITVKDDSCFATSRTILTSDSLLVMTSQCNLGRFTEQNSGATLEASYLTQLGCMENMFLADSVYGIGDHKFPEWFNQAVAGLKPYYANLRLYYTGFFGDSVNPIKIEVYPLDKMIDANAKYYHDVDPTQFYDATAKPLASVTVSGWNLQDHDTIRNKSTYYPSITIPLQDSIAKTILESYFNPDTRHYFADAASFMENLIKGFYVKCSQGDGTMLYIDRSVLQVTFRHISHDKNGNQILESPVAEFSGNSEVIQINCLKWTGLDSQLNNDSCTWIRSPFGVLTEITLPIDSMRDDAYVLNSALLRLSTAVTPSSRFKPSVPYRLLLIRKDNKKVEDFFNKNSSIDNIESFVSIYSSKYGTYTYNNIAALVEKIYSDRADWLKSHNMTLQDGGQAAYESEHPDWNKVVLIPVAAHLDSRNSPISYYLDINMHQVKFIGGNKLKLKIKTIRSKF